jgi:dTDP-4-dehydrorhamnose reductase
MTLRLLILGGNGLLGHAVWRAAAADPRVEAAASVRRGALDALPPAYRGSAQVCDVREEGALARLLDEVGPQVVVNCTGITKHVDSSPEDSIRVNSLMPHVLARLSAARGARLIHISTDCVFSGSKGRYHEFDLPDPPDVYGRSKLLGEVDYAPHVTLRTSFIGRELGTRRGLLEWFLSQHGTINGFRQAFWSGLGAPALARLLLEVCHRPDLVGLWHVAGERIDKYNLLLKLQAAFGKDDVVIEPVDQPVLDRSMDASRFAETGLRVPSMDDMIAELAREEAWQ